MRKNTFKKEERLCSKRRIQSLFHDGSSFVVYPFRVVFLVNTASVPSAQVLISVSKKRFKKAVDRNRIKRQIREVYRVEKGIMLYPFVENLPIDLVFALQYVSKEHLSMEVLTKRLSIVLDKMVKDISVKGTPNDA